MLRVELHSKKSDWTPILSYAVGLLVTDGNLSKDGRHINLRSAEIEQLSTFKKCLGLKNTIGSTPNQGGYRVQFCNIQLYNWLLKIGIFPAKTYTIGVIKVPDIFFRDFLRGHLDGDGTVRYYIDRFNNYRGRTYKNYRLYTNFISASEKHILWLRSKIIEITDLKGAIIKSKPPDEKHVPIWTVKFSKKESVKLLNWIYYDRNIPCLGRKRIIAETALAHIQNEERKPYSYV